MGCLISLVGKVGLILLSIVYFKMFVLGLAIVVVCSLLLTGGWLVKTLEERAVELLNSLLSHLFVNKAISTEDFDIITPFRGFLFCLTIVGAFLMVKAISGLIAITCKIILLMIAHVTALSFLLLIQIGVLISAETEATWFEGIIKAPLEINIRHDYSSHMATDAVNLFWNTAMLYFQCCGVDNYKNFENATYWNRTLNINGQIVQMDMPPTCCKQNKTKVGTTYNLPNCTKAWSADNWKDTGCYKVGWQTFLRIVNSSSGIWIITIAILVQVIAIVLGVLITINFRKKS